MVPKLVAHRGFMEKYPENSLPGIEAALNRGACMVELDVQMCAERKLVVLHDSTLNRTAGVDASVFDMGLQELSELSVHEPMRLGEKFRKTFLPTLEEVLAMVARYPDAVAFVEIKQESIDRFGLEPVIDELLETLAPCEAQCVIISYSLDALSYVKNNSGLKIGWVLDAFDLVHYQLADRLAPEYLVCNHTKIPDDREPWKGDWQWMLYDITTPDLALHWAKRGVALIETRDIETMLENSELKQRACEHGA